MIIVYHVVLDKSGKVCHTMGMNKTNTTMTNITKLTERSREVNTAITVLEQQYAHKYCGTKTVNEMCTSLTDRIMWEDANPSDVYHIFGNKIVSDDMIIAVANSYA